MEIGNLNERIDEFIARYQDEMVRDIAELVAVESTRGKAAPDAPFGPGPRKALDTALEIAKRQGFTVRDCDGYLGWAELQGKEDGVLAVISHIDVVPVGEGWTGDPFILRQRDGWLIGRGVSDDKGPAVMSMYAARFIRESGISLRYKLRLLFGCDEESGMSEVPYYLEREGQPLFCISPDAGFPVCNGEKGIFSGDFISGELGDGDILDFRSGIASNVIPDSAFCVLRGHKELAAEEGIEVIFQDGNTLIKTHGIGGHAAAPGNTRNAIWMLVEYLVRQGVGNEAERGFLRLLYDLHSATDGSGLGIDSDDGFFDPLTCIGGMISVKDGKLTQNINIRYPTNITGHIITERLVKKAGDCGAEFNVYMDTPPFYIPAETPAIRTLLTAWNEVSGYDDAPYTMGGGTYARNFANAVSFGIGDVHEVRPEFAGREHMADEAVSLSSICTALKVYILSLIRLQDVDFS